MKKLFLGIVFVGVILLAALAYLGVLPLISPLIAKPIDLGIEADQTLVTQFDQAHGMINELPNGVVPSDREPIYEGEVSLDIELNSAQVTSILAYWRGRYAKMPIRDVQIRFNPDGTSEASGILEIGTAITMAKQLGYSEADIEKGKSYVKYIAGDLPFYLKGTASVSDNQVMINPTTMQVGRVNVPASIMGPVASVVDDAIERKMKQVPGLSVSEMTISNGILHLVATSPNTIK